MARDMRLQAAARGLWRYGAALGLVAMSSILAEVIHRLFETDRLSMVFLASVLVSAVALGQGPAYFAAAVAFVVYDIYLVQPRGVFTFATAEDVIVLGAFLAVAVMTGGLAGRLGEAQRRAEARARVSSALFRASEEFSGSNDEDAVRQALVGRIGEAGRTAVVFYGDSVWTAPAGKAPPPELARLVAGQQAAGWAGAETVEIDGWRLRPLRAEGRAAGLAAWRPSASGPASDEERLVDVLVDVAGAAIARSRLATVRAEIQARDRTEQLRNALLSSISHDLRTPLAAILASASSLREFGDRFEPAVREDLILTIQEEAERLNAFVGNLLNMTKLEAGGLEAAKVTFGMGEVVDRVAVRLRRRAGAREIAVAAEGDLPTLGDPILAEQALANVIENAIRFSPPDARIDVRARRAGDRVRIEVADQGPGAPLDELPLLFEKFYRSPATSAGQQGAGLGLSITRGFVEAMGGEVAAGPRPDAHTGLVISIDLPGAAP